MHFLLSVAVLSRLVYAVPLGYICDGHMWTIETETCHFVPGSRLCDPGLVCVRQYPNQNGGRCRSVMEFPECTPGVTTTSTTTTSLPTTTSSTSTTTPPPSTTTTTVSSTTTTLVPVRFPALRAQPWQLSPRYPRAIQRPGISPDLLNFWYLPAPAITQVATQPERSAMQGMALQLTIEAARYGRRMPRCAGLQKDAREILTAGGVRFHTSGNYAGRPFPPALGVWDLDTSGATDFYAAFRDLGNAVQYCSRFDPIRCAATIPPVLRFLGDLRIEDGRCVVGAGVPLPIIDGIDRERVTAGVIVGRRMFSPPAGLERELLDAAVDAHHENMLAGCAGQAPPRDLQGVLMAFENEMGRREDADAALQFFVRLYDFSGFADTAAAAHPLDPPDTVYWSPDEACAWRMATDQAFRAWGDCIAAGGPWGRCDMLGRLHQFVHQCLNWRDDGFRFRFPSLDGGPLGPPLTCPDYLAVYRALGRLP